MRFKPFRPQHKTSPHLEPLEGRRLPSGFAVNPVASGNHHQASLGFHRGSETNAGAGHHSRVHAFQQTQRQFHNLPYVSDTGMTRRLDVYLPAGDPPATGWPVVMAIHGGGWRRFSKEEYAPKASILTNYGYAVVLPDYTLSSPTHPAWPYNIQDVRGSVRWVRLNSAGFHFDPNRVAAMGESAGGHLALLLGTTPDPVANPAASAAIQTVVSFAGPTDLRDLAAASPFAGTAAQQMIGASSQQDPSAYFDASPVTHVKATGPPMLLIQGLHDNVVPPSQTDELVTALKATHARFQLLTLPDSGHLIPLNPGSITLNRLLQFLGTQSGLNG